MFKAVMNRGPGTGTVFKINFIKSNDQIFVIKTMTWIRNPGSKKNKFYIVK